MAKKKTRRPIKAEDIASSFGVALSLFALLIMLSPNTHFWGLAYGIDYLFGFAGFWFFCPFLFIVGFLSTWKRKLPKIPGWRYFFGFLFLFIFSLLLLAHLGAGGAEKYSDTSPFLNEIAAAASGENGGLAFDTRLGGGIVGYILAGLLNETLGPWLVYLSIALAAVIGLVFFFFPEIKIFFRSLKNHHTIAKSRKSQHKADQAKADQMQDQLFTSPSENPSLNEASDVDLQQIDASPASFETEEPEAVAPAAAMPTPSPTPSYPSRRSLHEAAPSFSQPVPQEMATSPSLLQANGVLLQAGLQPAIFLGDDAPAEPAPSSPKIPSFAPVQKEAPAAPISQPEPQKSVEAAPSPLPAAPLLHNQITLEEPEEASPIPPVPAAPLADAVAPQSQPIVSPVEPEIEPEPESEPEEVTPPAPTANPGSYDDTPTLDPSLMQPKIVAMAPYKNPPFSLLMDYPPDEAAAKNEADCEIRTGLIDKAFQDLHVGARVTSHTIGPSVTRYDVETDPDVSVTQIGKYIKDISVRLGGVATRFEEMVAGKTTSGLEIANKMTTIVPFKEAISSLPTGPKDNLYIPFGKSISGEFVSADLSDFPHMLVSGTTGSGKSIFVHGVIMSLIMRNSPEQLRIILVDPKRVEMAKYKDLPHLLCPIIKDAGQAKVCFNKLIDEMERRYTLFELAGVSNIRQFNKEYAAPAGVQPLPFIVVFVDEYADLVDTCKDIGGAVVRLAQKARAAGIHLVIATQRPDVNVITGTIKANLAVRVALMVSSVTDSMTILGQGGAEQLSPHGDMLVDCSLVSRSGFTRVQGCMVDNNEIKAVADYIRNEHPTVYDPKFLDLVDHSQDSAPSSNFIPNAPTPAELKSSSDEDKYLYIKECIMSSREYTSISQIQREFGVGFPRAGRIFARLQKEGVVASQTESASSSKGCKVLMHSNPPEKSVNPGSTESSDVIPENFAQPPLPPSINNDGEGDPK